MIYVLDCWAFKSVICDDSKISDLKGVQWCSPKKPSIWSCAEMKDRADVGISKKKGLDSEERLST